MSDSTQTLMLVGTGAAVVGSAVAAYAAYKASQAVKAAAGGAAAGVGDASKSGSDVSIADELREMRLQTRRLQAELEAVRETSILASAGAGAGAMPGPFGLTRQDSTSLEDGSEIDMDSAEVARMREIFALFDTDGRGYISASAVQDLHARLGEPITDAEAAEAVKAIGAEDGKVRFPAFVTWWQTGIVPSDTENRGESERYQARFKFLKAKIANPRVGRMTAEGTGVFGSLEYRVHFYHTDEHGVKTMISPWHSIPLFNDDGTLNFVCEIPKWTRKKFEIATGEPFNPIKQDTKNGQLREYKWGDMLFNYGAFPQTWEDPAHVTEDTGAIGDNDPLDVMELGSKSWTTGSIVPVKVIGVLALIDSGETDWKVLTINKEDPLADKINDIDDLEAQMPGAIEAIHLWLRDYKSRNKPPVINKFGFDGKCQPRKYAMEVVHETHAFWKALVKKHPNSIGGATV